MTDKTDRPRANPGRKQRQPREFEKNEEKLKQLILYISQKGTSFVF